MIGFVLHKTKPIPKFFIYFEDNKKYYLNISRIVFFKIILPSAIYIKPHMHEFEKYNNLKCLKYA